MERREEWNFQVDKKSIISQIVSYPSVEGIGFALSRNFGYDLSLSR